MRLAHPARSAPTWFMSAPSELLTEIVDMNFHCPFRCPASLVLILNLAIGRRRGSGRAAAAWHLPFALAKVFGCRPMRG